MDAERLTKRQHWLPILLLLNHILLIIVVVLEGNAFWLILFILLAYFGLVGACFMAYSGDVTLSSVKAFDMADSAARLALKIAWLPAVVYLVIRGVFNPPNEAGLKCLAGLSGSLALLFLIYTCGYGGSLWLVSLYKRRRGL
jgi:hypothetical protein